ncbi:threonine/homoserine/homoserine lactone efflux protein [Comamonas sp. BIGb0152]|uniref:LysE family translocator n=1 Tax=Comamonas sp. BIGb0152 TaxID=2940601 RepID=UPI002167920C|nr:LysE family translocator [Comamonas sp. BIGb0152]MCS4294197.1 threonine/homoserine/homoserine lactone efflux protein [Comamonas sp. BIGb0152]
MSVLPETSAFVLPLALFAFVSSVTPGPNNVMLTASGASFGYRRTVPHMLGISLGVVAMLLLVGLGLGVAFEREPRLYTWLKYLGAAYLLWLAWKIARAGQAGAGQTGAQPLGFWQAAAFQWVNPKAWIMAIGIVATYTPRDGYAANLLLAALVLGLVNYPSVSVWTLFGSAVGRALRTPQALQRFNWCMAALLVLSLYPVLAA